MGADGPAIPPPRKKRKKRNRPEYSEATVNANPVAAQRQVQTRRLRQAGISALPFAAGLVGNALANDIRYWSIAAVLFVMLFFGAVWLRPRPSSLIARTILWTLLALALAATLAAAAAPPPWTGYATLTAASLSGIAVLIPECGHCLQVLVVFGFIGGGAAVGGSAIRYLTAAQGNTLFNIAVLAYALAGAGIGLAFVIGPKDAMARLGRVSKDHV
jgi:hypothetical protein